jgi:hypothetical protein
MNTNRKLEKLQEDLISTLKLHAEREEKTTKEQRTRFDRFSKTLFSFIQEARLVSQQQILLQTLLFEEIQQREENIKDAHKATLDWMFEKSEIKFMDWLKTEQSIYWVKGKVYVLYLKAPRPHMQSTKRYFAKIRRLAVENLHS